MQYESSVLTGVSWSSRSTIMNLHSQTSARTVANTTKQKKRVPHAKRSPYSWLAFETLMRYRNVWDAQVHLRPFLLGGVMKATG